MTAEVILFWAFAVGSVLGSLLVVSARNAINCAMSLVATFFFLAGIYVLLWAHTIAVLQVLVYAGAIMVLFLFVIMLLSLTDIGPAMRFSLTRLVGVVATAGLLAALWTALRTVPAASHAWTSDPVKAASFGSLKAIGALVYTQWLFPFEAVSLLLLVAIVGAVVVAKPRISKGASGMGVPSQYFLILAAALFCIGMLGVLIRRNALVVFMCIELMLNAANLTFVAFARDRGDMQGHVAAFFIIAVAAAEAAVGLAIVIAIFRSRGTLNVEEIRTMKH